MEARDVMYPIKCSACGFRGDVFARLAEMDSVGRLPCPDCGKPADQDYERKTLGKGGQRKFFGMGQRSLQEGWNPIEVDQVQREMVEHGDVDAANMISKDGTVRFKSREEQRKYMAAKARIWQRVQDGPSEAPSLEALQERVATKIAAKNIMKRAKAMQRGSRRRK